MNRHTAMFEHVMSYIDEIGRELTLKADYTKEIALLNRFEGVAKQFRDEIWEVPGWKITDGLNRIKRLRDWMKEEMSAGVMGA